ncbi:MAG: putative selenate ABC transporter substrate-binding protein, partial [Gallionella sp.]
MFNLSSSPRLMALLVSFVIVAGLMFYAASSAETVLRVSLVPDEAPFVLRRKFIPLSEYLEKKIGMKVEFRPSADANSLINALVTNKLDMVWFSGFDFVRARSRSDNQVTPIAQRAEDAQTRSVFITARNDITSLEDLEGKVLAFGKKTSTSGHLMPRSYMRTAYMNPDIEMKRLIYSDSNNEVVAAVTGGMADAGVLNKTIWEKKLANGEVDPNKLHVFYTTPRYHDYNWTVHASMDSNLRQKLTDAFISMDKRIGIEKEIMAIQRASKFISTTPENYSPIETVARS